MGSAVCSNVSVLNRVAISQTIGETRLELIGEEGRLVFFSTGHCSGSSHDATGSSGGLLYGGLSDTTLYHQLASHKMWLSPYEKFSPNHF